MLGMYILDDDDRPVPVDDAATWSRWMQEADQYPAMRRRVVNDVLPTRPDGSWVRVSTVFLGLDHGFGEAHPLLYETLVFGGKLDGDTVRYTTREDARAGHMLMVARVRDAERA